MTFSNGDRESLLLRKGVGAVKSYEACSGYSAAPHEPSRALLEEDHLVPAAWWAYWLHTSLPVASCS